MKQRILRILRGIKWDLSLMWTFVKLQSNTKRENIRISTETHRTTLIFLNNEQDFFLPILSNEQISQSTVEEN